SKPSLNLSSRENPASTELGAVQTSNPVSNTSYLSAAPSAPQRRRYCPRTLRQSPTTSDHPRSAQPTNPAQSEAIRRSQAVRPAPTLEQSREAPCLDLNSPATIRLPSA